jgi:hypothetical protein
VRLRARTDSNHKAIVDALRKVGCQVADLSQLGNGIPDLLVSYRNGNRRDLALLEIKAHRGRQTAAQLKFESEGWEVFLVRSVSEALRVIGVEL